VQAIDGLFWQDAETGLFTLTEQAGLTKYYDRGLGDGYRQYPWSPDEWVFFAKVVGEICDCEVEWSWNEGDWVYPPVVRFQGNLAIVSAPAESFLGDDVLEISATACGQSFGPITLTIADEAYA
jgi:hypothetical protein